MNVFDHPRGGKPYHIYDEDYKREAHEEFKRCRHLCWLINSADPRSEASQAASLVETWLKGKF